MLKNIKIYIFILMPLFLVYLLISIAYLASYIDYSSQEYSFIITELSKYINLHDHNIYYEKMYRLNEHGAFYELNNDFGIALLYKFLYFNLSAKEFLNVFELAFLVNLIFFVLSFIYYNKICTFDSVSYPARFLFFFNFSFLYFMQLMNKDMVTVFILLYSLYYLLKSQPYMIFLILPFSFLVRQQLAICIIVFLILSIFKYRLTLLAIFYLTISIASAVVSSEFNIISDESVGEGFSSFILKFNNNYFNLGNFLFNPLRVILYFFSIPQSIFHVYTGGELDYAAFLRFCTIPLLLISAWFFVKCSLKLIWCSRSVCWPYYSLSFSFFITWLINPTINGRYITLIIPVMVLGFYKYRMSFKN